MSNRLYTEMKTKIEEGGMDLAAPVGTQAIQLRAEQLRAVEMGRLLAVATAPNPPPQAKFGQQIARARMANELAGLDDRMLADIGMRRDDIPGFVAGQIEFARKVMAENAARREPANEPGVKPAAKQAA